jgi:epoxyqueuosine reductase
MQPAPETAQGPLRADDAVRQHARALGFDVVGVARADEPLGADHERYLSFVERGMHGAMGYLAEHAAARRRVDGPEILEGARSVICVGRRYGRAPADEAADPELARTIARYARGQDYHKFLRRRLQRLAAFVRTLGEGVQARPLVDIEPVLERAWAARAGLGFVGKNGLVITPGQGSYQLLGEVVTTLELTPGTPLEERCGSCTRCLDACPTGAFAAPFVLDPRRCIAYLTIELHEPPPPELREAVGEHLFGCDACQEVCPFNRGAATAAEAPAPFRPLPRWGQLDLEKLTTLDEAGWRSASEGTPLRRAGRVGVARAAALVAAARLRAGAVGAEADVARRALSAAAAHDDPSVREVAAWAGEGTGKPE